MIFDEKRSKQRYFAPELGFLSEKPQRWKSLSLLIGFKYVPSPFSICLKPTRIPTFVLFTHKFKRLYRLYFLVDIKTCVIGTQGVFAWQHSSCWIRPPNRCFGRIILQKHSSSLAGVSRCLYALSQNFPRCFLYFENFIFEKTFYFWDFLMTVEFIIVG